MPVLTPLIERGRTDLSALGTLSVANTARKSGSGDFTLRVAGDKIEARRITGDTSLDNFREALQSAHLPLRIPPSAPVEIPLRGTLSCKSDDDHCHFALLTSDAAVDLARKEASGESAAPTAAADPHLYDNPGLGIRISLPDEWQMVRDEPGSFSRPHNVIFGKPGSLARAY